MASVSIAVLTRDLRVHDNPVLAAAAADGGAVLPVFVLDDAILGSDYNRPNRPGSWSSRCATSTPR